MAGCNLADRFLLLPPRQGIEDGYYTVYPYRPQYLPDSLVILLRRDERQQPSIRQGLVFFQNRLGRFVERNDHSAAILVDGFGRNVFQCAVYDILSGESKKVADTTADAALEDEYVPLLFEFRGLPSIVHLAFEIEMEDFYHLVFREVIRRAEVLRAYAVILKRALRHLARSLAPVKERAKLLHQVAHSIIPSRLWRNLFVRNGFIKVRILLVVEILAAHICCNILKSSGIDGLDIQPEPRLAGVALIQFIPLESTFNDKILLPSAVCSDLAIEKSIIELGKVLNRPDCRFWFLVLLPVVSSHYPFQPIVIDGIGLRTGVESIGDILADIGNFVIEALPHFRIECHSGFELLMVLIPPVGID